LPEAKVARVIAEATRGRSRWSVRSMAHHAGVSPSVDVFWTLMLISAAAVPLALVLYSAG
jgi:hypothetical protein